VRAPALRVAHGCEVCGQDRAMRKRAAP
jgi:hypothetical protein